MAFSRKNKSGRPRTERLRPIAISVPEPAQAVDSALSLPLAQSPESPVVPNYRVLPDDSKVRTKAMQILALRVAGLEEDQVAEQMGLSKGTIRNYIYLAGRNGWLDANVMLPSPVDQVEYTLLHKVVRNLDASLDSADKDERNAVTTKLFDATMAKHWAPVVSTGPSQQLVAIRIEMPPGPPQQLREGTVQGISAWVDGEES